jgi:hypothetical protein
LRREPKDGRGPVRVRMKVVLKRRKMEFCACVFECVHKQTFVLIEFLVFILILVRLDGAFKMVVEETVIVIVVVVVKVVVLFATVKERLVVDAIKVDTTVLVDIVVI